MASGVDASDLVRASRALKAAGRGDLRKLMNKEIREQTKPVVTDLRRAVQSIDSRVTKEGGAAKARREHRKGRGRAHGLRASIARAIQVKIRVSGIKTGVSIRVDTAKLPPDQKSLPKKLDSPRGWRHPVFGNRSSWVHQYGRPWWAATIEPSVPRVRDGVHGAVDKYLNQLQGDL